MTWGRKPPCLSKDIMTSQEIKNIITSGRVAVWNGKVISRLDEVPTDIELAGDNKELVSKAKGDIEKEIARLQGLLGKQSDEPKATKKAPEPPVVEEIDEPAESVAKGNGKDVSGKKAGKTNKKN